MISIYTINGKAMFFQPVLYFSLADRVLLLDIFLFNSTSVRKRDFVSAAEAGESVRRIEPDDFPCAFNQRSI